MSDSLGLETTASNIKANIEKRKKKITFDSEDAVKKPLKSVEVKSKEVSGNKAKTQTAEKDTRKHQEKHKITVYLVEEEMLALDDIVIKHIQKRDKRDLSSIMAEALMLLHKTKYV